MTMGGTNLTTMSERLSTYIQPWEAHPATMLERLSTYIRPWEAQPATMSERLIQHLHLTQSERHNTHI